MAPGSTWIVFSILFEGLTARADGKPSGKMSRPTYTLVITASGASDSIGMMDSTPSRLGTAQSISAPLVPGLTPYGELFSDLAIIHAAELASFMRNFWQGSQPRPLISHCSSFISIFLVGSS